MNEGEATRKLKKALEEHPRLKGRALVQRHVNTFYNSGTLDLSVSFKERTLWLELKMVGNKPTKLQQNTIDRLGAGARVITFSKDGKAAIIGSGSSFELSGVAFETLVERIADYAELGGYL